MNYYLTIINGRKKHRWESLLWYAIDDQIVSCPRKSWDIYLDTSPGFISSNGRKLYLWSWHFLLPGTIHHLPEIWLAIFFKLMTGGYVNTSYLIKGQILMFKSQYFCPKFRHKTELHKIISDFPIYLLEHPKTHQDLLLQIKEAPQRSCQQLAFGKKLLFVFFLSIY